MDRIINVNKDLDIVLGKFGARDEVKVIKRNDTAHWERSHLKGWWEGRFVVERNGGISVDITETGSKSSKRVMVTIPAEAVEQLLVLIENAKKEGV